MRFIYAFGSLLGETAILADFMIGALCPIESMQNNYVQMDDEYEQLYGSMNSWNANFGEFRDWILYPPVFMEG